MERAFSCEAAALFEVPRMPPWIFFRMVSNKQKEATQRVSQLFQQLKVSKPPNWPHVGSPLKTTPNGCDPPKQKTHNHAPRTRQMAPEGLLSSLRWLGHFRGRALGCGSSKPTDRKDGNLSLGTPGPSWGKKAGTSTLQWSTPKMATSQALRFKWTTLGGRVPVERERERERNI